MLGKTLTSTVPVFWNSLICSLVSWATASFTARRFFPRSGPRCLSFVSAYGDPHKYQHGTPPCQHCTCPLHDKRNECVTRIFFFLQLFFFFFCFILKIKVSTFERFWYFILPCTLTCMYKSEREGEHHNCLSVYFVELFEFVIFDSVGPSNSPGIQGHICIC